MKHIPILLDIIQINRRLKKKLLSWLKIKNDYQDKQNNYLIISLTELISSEISTVATIHPSQFVSHSNHENWVRHQEE